MRRPLMHPDYYSHVVRTETHRVRWEGVDIWLKDETQQVSGSFKFRGGVNAALRLPGARLVTASTGNHAAGLAAAASRTGGSARVVLPHTTPQVKRDRVSAVGGEIVLHGDDYDAASRYAIEMARRTGAVYVPSFDDSRIIRGHAPLFFEARQCGADAVDLSVVPVGGGGLLASALLAAPGRVCGVELDSAPAMSRSLAAGEQVDVEVPQSRIAEGLLVRRVGALPFRLARACGATVRTVSADELMLAVRWCWQVAGVRVETAGAAAVAGLFSILADVEQARRPRAALCILTGGNIDADSWSDIVNGPFEGA